MKIEPLYRCIGFDYDTRQVEYVEVVPDYEAAGFVWSLASRREDWDNYTDQERVNHIAEAKRVVDAALQEATDEN